MDLSIEKEFLGFSGEKDPEKMPSASKRKQAIESLAEACSSYIQDKLLPNLQKEISTQLGEKAKWELLIDDEDPDGQTLWFRYPTDASLESDIRPAIKIEMGARAEHWPVSEHIINSYVKKSLSDKVDEAGVSVRVLNAERTFWEKATILHQYAHFPSSKKFHPRISRHLYDFFQLLNSPIKQAAVEKSNLLERVAIHKSIYFASSWANYDAARKGSLRLTLPDHLLAELEKDYGLMKAMFFGEIPEWQRIIKSIEDFEKQFNEKS